MLGWLSGFSAQIGSVADCGKGIFSRHLGEAAVPWGECGPCPDIASYTLAFALQLNKIAENLRVGERRSAPSVILLVDLAIGRYNLDWPAGPCCPWLSRQAKGQPSVSVSICRVAIQGGSSHHLTLSQSSQSGL